MNLHDPKHPWTRLVTAARAVSDNRDSSAPYGFATRLAALAFAPERTVASLFDRFALRAVGVSCLLAVLSVAVNYSHLSTKASAPAASSVEDEMPADSPVDLLLSD